MVFKVNNKLMPFSKFGGSFKRHRTTKKRKKIKKRSITKKRRRTLKKHRRTTKKRRRKSKRHLRGGFIRSHSPVFNWGNKCDLNNNDFKLEY